MYFRGSVIFPLRMLAATVAGEARYMDASVEPILPGKFLFVELMQTSPSLIIPS